MEPSPFSSVSLAESLQLPFVQSLFQFYQKVEKEIQPVQKEVQDYPKKELITCIFNEQVLLLGLYVR